MIRNTPLYPPYHIAEDSCSCHGRVAFYQSQTQGRGPSHFHPLWKKIILSCLQRIVIVFKYKLNGTANPENRANVVSC